jgi:hypothetical protein
MVEFRLLLSKRTIQMTSCDGTFCQTDKWSMSCRSHREQLVWDKAAEFNAITRFSF